ncbi:MAG: cytochrome c [Chloroflexia bacterium]|nr:cytochrome c [Chloroflexia bacterium]
MPPFKGTLKEEEIWSVVNYLRVLVNPSLVPPAKDVILEIIANDEQKTITALVSTSDSLKQPLSEIDVHFYIKRDFGVMRFGETSNYTGTDGKVTVMFPENIIGNVQGIITIVGKVENNFFYNDISASIDRAWGVNLKTEDDKFNQRSLWGARSKSPIWLLLLANGILFAVWAVIVYIIFNLRRIKKTGKVYLIDVNKNKE